MTNWKELKGVALLCSAVVTTGCATAGATTSDFGNETQKQVSDATDGQEDARINSLEQDVKTRDARIERLQTQLGAKDQTSEATGALFPPDARPGQCYARVLTEEKYRTLEEQVLVQEESESVTIIPARYEVVQERVLVKEESTRIETVPAEYEMVTEQMLVQPASKKVIEVPATFRTATEQVLDKPAYTVWKRGPASGFSDPVLSQSTSATGEVMCLVEVPASYKTITRKVVDVAAHTNEVEVPAEYKSITKRVVKKPASTREITIPAEYETVSVRKLVQPGKESRTKIPAKYRTVTKTEKIADAELAWKPVLCQVNATPSNVMALQRALESKGYTVGPIDGKLGRQTFSAVSRYAAENGIPHGSNFVPLEVIKDLNLKI
jgi:peptidoglycan hydrolase-like protein with peptidoglycan-binding domain